MRRLASAAPFVAWAIVASAAAIAGAQEPAQQTPAFRTSIDLVPVDVSVIGNDGKPVLGLGMTDFVVSVDGNPRKVTSAEFVSTASDTPAAPAAAATGAGYSSNSTIGGRLILFLIDQASITRGRGKEAIDSASRFISGLSPADRVALIAAPTGAQIDFTSDHARVRTAIARLVGQADTYPLTFRMGITEAIDVHRDEYTALNRVFERECAEARTPSDREYCRERMLGEAASLAAFIRKRSHQSYGVLRAATERLARLPGPKTVVFMSEGLVVDTPADLSWLGPIASKAQMTIQVVQIDAATSDASLAVSSATPGADRSLSREGLEMLAGMTRGGLFPIVSNADQAFARLAQELSGYYLLGFEAEAADRNGQIHKIKVTVPARSGVQIRSRNEFAVDAARVRSHDTLLQDMLDAPLLATDIGLKLATFTLREPSSDKIRMLMVAEIDRAANPDGPLAFGYALTDERGRVISSRVLSDVKAPVHAMTRSQTYTAFLPSDTIGPHTLKIAVLDDKGRRGSVEHAFTASLQQIGELKAADLLLVDGRAGGGAGSPRIAGDFTSGSVNTYLELYAKSPEALANTGVIFEIAENEKARALDGAAGRIQPASAESPTLRAIDGTISTALLPPGNYVVRATINVDGQKVGQIIKPVKVGKIAAAPTDSPSGGLTVSSAPVPFVSRSDRFERTSVLTPRVVGFFVERLDFAARGESSPGPTIEHAREGRFEEAVRALSTRSGTVPSTFLSGLALFAKGELEPAAAKFRETLKLDSEFFPAAFYLGSCYAAGGRDREAVGAWQLSLVTQSDAPFIFTLLGDALLRLRDIEQALEVLNEAAAAWPEDEEVQVRIGIAYAMSGKPADALQKIEPYLAKHPEDVDRHFIALRTLYQARTAGKPVRTTEEDRALFTRWSAAYAAAKGPQKALVDQWQRAMNR